MTVAGVRRSRRAGSVGRDVCCGGRAVIVPVGLRNGSSRGSAWAVVAVGETRVANERAGGWKKWRRMPGLK